MITANQDEQRIGKIETDVAVINTKIDGLSQSLHGINLSLEKQTEILGKFLAYSHEQESLEESVEELKRDYKQSKETLLAGMGWLKGFVYAGTFALAFGQAVGVYFIKDKVEILKDVQDRVNKIEIILSGGTIQK